MLAVGKIEAVLIVTALIGVVLLKKKLTEPGFAQEAGADVAHAAVDAVAGIPLGIGDAIGIPRTNETECEKAMREGRDWDASFACDAATFIKYKWNNQ